MTPFYKTLHILVGWFVRLIFNVKVVGRENEPKKGEGPFIICANHLSATDPVAIGVSLRYVQPNFMAKSQLFKNKILAWLFYNLGCYPVSRSGNDVGALKTTLRLLKEGKCIGIFPQGTRHPGVDPETTKVRGGVGMICGYSGAKVLPIYIDTKDNTTKLFRRRTVIIGKPITPEEIAYVPRQAGEYDRISKLVFDRICLLGREYKESKKK
jgi:1-acyl-sn-glycerol-3-phosphate acyltransferase